MSITMQELAHMAGVSRSTVDRVLNRRGRVNIETEQRILQLAKEMGYTPNLVAKTLASKNKAYKIGCVINSVGNAFFEEVVSGIEHGINEFSTFGMELSIIDIENLSVSEQLHALTKLEQEDVCAIIISPVNDPKISDKLNQLIDKGICVISVSADIENVNYLSYVGCNHKKSGQITANLAALICDSVSNILFVVGSTLLYGHRQRLEGFKHVITQKYPSMNICEIIENQDDNFISYNHVTETLKKHPEINLIIFAAGGSKGGIRAVQDMNHACKIIAFDLTKTNLKALQDDVLCGVLFQDPYSQGYTSVKLVADYLLYGNVPNTTHYYTQTTILLRESL